MGDELKEANEMCKQFAELNERFKTELQKKDATIEDLKKLVVESVVAQFAKELVRMDQVKRAEGKSK
jgi:uncharacterized protein YeaO (DUF488 family)